MKINRLFGFLLLITLSTPVVHAVQENPLPSWNEGDSKASIMAFVRRVSTAGGADYVAPNQRIAAFDNDGTLWSE